MKTIALIFSLFLKSPAWIWKNLGKNNFTRMIWSGIIVALVAFTSVGSILWTLSRDLPDLDKLKKYEPRLTTRIYDRHGYLLAELFKQQRLIAPLDIIPQHTIDAIIATEDRRFYHHWGMDIIRVFSSAMVNIASFKVKQGASTITQQLARDLYLHKRQTFTRKIREVLTALQIERNYSKEEILEMYLTQIYFGHGAYGIGSAARKYFGKTVDSLDLAESALLAALPKAPGRYSPRFHPERALKRRNLVLRGMLKNDFIKSTDYNTAIIHPIELIPQDSKQASGIAPYFTEMIRQTISEEGRRLGFEYL
nr:transglycosylase domain-containing protein [Deltaproteobacteria bacterium]